MYNDLISHIVAKNMDKNNFYSWRSKLTNFLMGKGN